ncbi:unnamed protein product [Cylicocyclus nassatus]|uniref:Uncharacterized protein n=1 Tax=Cylicocyclus nassatus TaxID=53992 RepID=A0AA36M5I8_CYLNA|nr:unnamed protein product [Cylicocyclus nassatus]
MLLSTEEIVQNAETRRGTRPSNENPTTITSVITSEPEEEETADPGVMGGNLLKSKIDNRHRLWKSGTKDNTSVVVIIIGIVAIMLACVIAISVILVVIILRKRKKKEQQVAKKFVMAKTPRKMECADLNATKFTHGGALVLDAKLHGPVVHAEGDAEGRTIQTVQFDPHLNEIVDIGTNIDVLPETNDTTTVATTAAAEKRTIMEKVIKLGKVSNHSSYLLYHAIIGEC